MENRRDRPARQSATEGICAHSVKLWAIPMHEPVPPSPDRLDSWKAIADYLGRDVATVRRWERFQGLPVRRINAGRGRSVFAYASEINAWLRSTPSGEVQADDTETALAASSLPESRSRPARRQRRWPLVAAMLLVASGLFWSIPLWTSEPLPYRAESLESGVAALDKAGKQLWHYAFSSAGRAVPSPPFAEAQVLAGAEPGVMAATAYSDRVADGVAGSGELLWLTPKGALSRAFSFGDRLTVGARPYGEPWVISSFRVDESGVGRRIAVSARHYTSWPSVVTVLDKDWRRQGTFYNAGWVDQVHWLSPDRLLVSGYANAHEGGMVGIVDAAALDGQSPAGADPTYRCSTCGPESASRYVVLPRSEVNQASGASLNGAVVQVLGDRVLVRTIEFRRLTEAVEVLYEFSPSLELIGASYGDRYWEMHRALEADGKIDHARDRCPNREGPGIRVWDKTSGWKTIASGAR